MKNQNQNQHKNKSKIDQSCIENGFLMMSIDECLIQSTNPIFQELFQSQTQFQDLLFVEGFLLIMKIHHFLNLIH